MVMLRSKGGGGGAKSKIGGRAGVERGGRDTTGGGLSDWIR